MKVIVTGATGFVGGHLVEKLVKEGYEVRALAHSDKSNTSVLKSLDVEIVYGDVLDSDAMEKAIQGCQQVYHLVVLRPRYRLPKRHIVEQVRQTNIQGTENVARAALKANVERLVYTSSVGVYGFITNSPVDETTKPNPNNLRRECKWVAEQVMLSYHQKHDLPVVIARLTGVLGARTSNWLKLFKDIANQNFRMIGSGENYEHPTCVADIVEGIKLCGRVKDIEGEVYNIASEQPIKVKDLVSLIAEELNVNNSFARSPALFYQPINTVSNLIYKYLHYDLPFSKPLDMFLANRIFDISKAKKELGYQPKVSYQESISQTANWYIEKGYI